MNIKRNLTYSLSLALFLGLFSTVNAQAGRNRVERAQDQRQIQLDKATIQRDRNEIQQFRGYRAGLSQAIARNNRDASRGHYTKLLAAMEREVQQSNNKVVRAQNEVRQSNAEVRSETRQVRKSRANAQPVKTANNRQDRNDDMRDLRDDRNDLAEVRRRAARQQEILNTIKGIKINHRRKGLPAIQAKMHLIDEFEQTMIRDMGENYEELAEDKGELREDRRERGGNRR